MTEDTVILAGKLDKLIDLLAPTDYCDTAGALQIIGLKNLRDLKKLNEQGILPRFKRTGRNYVYKKSDCKRAAEMLDNKEVFI